MVVLGPGGRCRRLSEAAAVAEGLRALNFLFGRSWPNPRYLQLFLLPSPFPPILEAWLLEDGGYQPNLEHLPLLPAAAALAEFHLRGNVFR